MVELNGEPKSAASEETNDSDFRDRFMRCGKWRAAMLSGLVAKHYPQADA
jgi:hypothetical protein